MSADEKQEFPVWERLYQEREIESMPWFNPELDTDLKQALDELGVQSGSTLDLWALDPVLRRCNSLAAASR